MATKEDKAKELYQIYLRWKVVPPSIREASNFKSINVEQFMEEHKLSRSDIARFESAPSFEDDYQREKIKWAKRRIPEMMDVLYMSFKEKKSPADLKAFLEVTESAAAFVKEEDEEVAETTVTGIDPAIFNIPEDVKRELITRAARRIGLIGQ